MKKIDPIKIIEAMDQECLKKQGPLFERQFMDHMVRVLRMELTNAQINRVIKLVSHMSKGYQKREFDFYTVSNVVFSFVMATVGKNKDQVKSIFRSFLSVPKFVHSTLTIGHLLKGKNYKGLNSDEKSRERWGAENKMESIMGYHEYYDRYLKLLIYIKKASK